MEKSLTGKVAVVTGASRGLGKGIALSLGERGATVYAVGRTGAGDTPAVPLAGDVERTAAEVATRGGVGRAARVDQRDDAQTEALFERVRREEGGVDILVNCAWAGYEGLHKATDFPLNQPFWERRLGYWDDNAFGLRAAYVASALAARMMVDRGGGLIVNLTAFVDLPDESSRNLAYFAAKAGAIRLTADMARELKSANVAAIALIPGLVRTEGVMLYEKYLDLSQSESVEFAGRAVAALAQDADVMAKTGRTMWVCDLAAEYGFRDVDGAVPTPSWKPR